MLPTPTADLVKQAEDDFDSNPYNQLVESAIAKLIVQFPANHDLSEVLLKVLAINQLYSSRVDSIHLEPLARHIVASKLDELLTVGSHDSVTKIASCPDYPKHYYSFATKYCSWHNQAAFPIYDANVDECLWSYRKQDKFSEFRRYEMEDCSNYKRFVEVVSAFRKHYLLDQFPFKSLDKFLWTIGDRLLRSDNPLALISSTPGGRN